MRPEPYLHAHARQVELPELLFKVSLPFMDRTREVLQMIVYIRGSFCVVLHMVRFLTFVCCTTAEEASAATAIALELPLRLEERLFPEETGSGWRCIACVCCQCPVASGSREPMSW